MAAKGSAEALSLLRTLYRELRPTVNDPQKHVYQTQLWKYIMGLCRTCRNQPPSKTQEQIQGNLEQTGKSYLLYLQGTKEYFRISDNYKGAGERTADATAKLLGFKMPNEPRDTPKENVQKEVHFQNASAPLNAPTITSDSGFSSSQKIQAAPNNSTSKLSLGIGTSQSRYKMT